MNFQFAAFADEAGRAPEQQIAAMQRNGISYLEVRFVGGKNVSELTCEEAKEFRKQLDDGGIKVWSIGSPTGKIKITDPFEPHLDAFRHQLELADILGATRYRLFSFYEAYDSFDAVVDRLGQFLDAARGSGVVLCHENEKEIYGDVASRCVEIHKALPELRAVFDPANFIQCKQPTLPAWELLHSYVDYMHIKDCFEDGRVVPAGDGVGNLPELLRRYSAQGGQVVTLEPHLGKFVGLEKLENGKKSESAYHFANRDESFDAAANALRRILAEENG